MNSNEIYFYLFIAVLLYFVFFVQFKNAVEYNLEKSLDNTRIVYNKGKCIGCNVWNNKDARAKCDAVCMKIYPDKNAQFNGEWQRTESDLECGCEYVADLQNLYVGCPYNENITQESTKNDCYIWNNTEAKEKCQLICDKYLPDKNSEWTGKWKNTSTETSACECKFYD